MFERGMDMLEQKDIEIIKIAVGEVVNGRFDAIDQRFDAMDQRFDAMDERMDAMEERMDAMEERMDQKFDAMDKKFTSIAKKHESRMELILDEVVRVHEGLQGQIDRLEKNMNEMQQYYRIDKLENDNMKLLIQHVADLDRRVEKLENKTA